MMMMVDGKEQSALLGYHAGKTQEVIVNRKHIFIAQLHALICIMKNLKVICNDFYLKNRLNLCLLADDLEG